MDPATDWYSPETATFGDRLAGAREAANMKQTDLAKRLGIKVKTLRAWEDDLAEPRANRLQMLAGLLNVSLSWLLNGQGDGLDAPVDDPELSADLTAVITELRHVRAQMQGQMDRIARLEKRLRKIASSEPAA